MPFTSPSFVLPLPFDPPDSIPVSEFFFGEHEQQYGRHPLSESKPPFTCGITGKSYSAPEVKSRVEWLATALTAELGWTTNEGSDFDKVVAIYSINTIDTLTVSWATHRVGGTSAPISPAYAAEDVRNQLAAVGAKAVFTCVTLLSMTLDAAAAVGIPPSHVYLLEIPQQVSAGLSAPHHIKTVDQLIHDGKGRNIIETVQWSGGRGAEQVAYLCASSGTSGFPKTVKISHRNVIANAMQTKTYESQWHTKEPEFCLGLLPQSHSFGLILVCHGNIYRGDGVIVMPRFDVQEMLEAIDRFRLARLYLIPPLIHAMIKTPDLLSKYDLSSVSTIVVGAASLSAATVETLARLQPTWNILQGYGLTEAAVVVACTASHDIEFGSCGSLYPGYEARLIGQDGNEINECNEPGELLVRSPSVMLGYLDDDAATQENLTADGWLRTGDLVMMKKSRNGHSHIYIVDRVKELIKVQGLQVAPAELEALLRQHPAVEDVSVVPIEDEVAGELPLAFVVRIAPYISRDEDDLEDELRNFVKDRVASFKQLRGGVRFVNSLPKSTAGKVLRKNLKEMAKEQQQRNRVVNGHGKDTESAGKEEELLVDAVFAKLIGKVEILEFDSDEE